MSLREKVELLFKKNVASLALKFSGYRVERSHCTLNVFDKYSQFCTVRKNQYISFNDLPTSQNFALNVYFLKDGKYDSAKRIFRFLDIPINRPTYYFDTEGNLRIIENGSHK